MRSSENIHADGTGLTKAVDIFYVNIKCLLILLATFQLLFSWIPRQNLFIDTSFTGPVTKMGFICCSYLQVGSVIVQQLQVLANQNLMLAFFYA